MSRKEGKGKEGEVTLKHNFTFIFIFILIHIDSVFVCGLQLFFHRAVFFALHLHLPIQSNSIFSFNNLSLFFFVSR
ncbi:hypothetical protein P8452_62036 [Trifolium repens]|nr:hypothetical protein P8452_62036 [Trifolium repens]